MVTYVKVYLDTNDTGTGTHGVGSHRNLEPNEKELSSTWRELTTISSGLQLVEGFLSGKSIIGSQIIMELPLLYPKVVVKTLTGPCS